MARLVRDRILGGDDESRAMDLAHLSTKKALGKRYAKYQTKCREIKKKYELELRKLREEMRERKVQYMKTLHSLRNGYEGLKGMELSPISREEKFVPELCETSYDFFVRAWHHAPEWKKKIKDVITAKQELPSGVIGPGRFSLVKIWDALNRDVRQGISELRSEWVEGWSSGVHPVDGVRIA